MKPRKFSVLFPAERGAEKAVQQINLGTVGEGTYVITGWTNNSETEVILFKGVKNLAECEKMLENAGTNYDEIILATTSKKVTVPLELSADDITVYARSASHTVPMIVGILIQ